MQWASIFAMGAIPILNILVCVGFVSSLKSDEVKTVVRVPTFEKLLAVA